VKLSIDMREINKSRNKIKRGITQGNQSIVSIKQVHRVSSIQSER
jgi:hypothetical protein